MNSTRHLFQLITPLLAIVFMLAKEKGNAQVGPPNSGTELPGTTAYRFAQSSGVYTAITGGTVYQAGATLNTDAVSSAVNIGFNFMYNNRLYSTVRISNNGFITFGANAPSVTNYTALSTNANPAYEGAIAGFGANLRVSAVPGGTPEIRYETLGMVPNRIFVVQYRDLAVLTTGTSQRLNFQIRLTETTNSVTIIYGQANSGAAASNGQLGLRGAESSDLNNRTGTNWTNTTPGTATSNTMTLGTTAGTSVPANGLTFSWAPGITWGAASYQALPYFNDFSAWTNGLNTIDIPGSNVRTWPSRGDNAWRASTNAVTGFASTVGWSSTNGAISTFSGAAVAPAARFHDYDVSSGSFGDMDFYLDMSGSSTNQYDISFLYNNPSGTDAIQVFYSGDGGATFTQLGANITSMGNNWSIVSRQTSGTATSVIRLRAVGSLSLDDIFIDNFAVTSLSCAQPTALAYLPSGPTGGTLSWINPTAGASLSYEYEIRSSGVAGSGADGLITSGTVAHPNNSTTIADGTLTPNTAYSAYIRTDCDGGDISNWSTATNFTTPCAPAIAPFLQTFDTAYSLNPTGYPACWREANDTINSSGNAAIVTGNNNWVSSNFANTGFNNGFKINLYGTHNDWVITEPITLGPGNWSLAYNMAVTNYNSTGTVSDLGTHMVRVIVSTDNGINWSNADVIKTYTGTASYSTTGVMEYISLNAYAGQTIQIAFAATSSTIVPDIDFHLDNIEVFTPCSGTPVIGPAAGAFPTTLDCTGSVVNLTMDTDAQALQGFAFQWQSSADGVTFANIAGATGADYSTPTAVTSSTYFRGIATCAFSGLTFTTADFFVEETYPTPSVAAFPPLHCGTGGTSVLTASITGANPYDTFVWSSPETGVLSNQTNTSADFSVTESAAFTYTVTDIASGCSKVVSQSVNVFDGINPIMTATPAIICAGSTSTLQAQISNAAFSYYQIPYNSLPTSTVLASGGVAMVPLSSGTLDDGGWGNVPLGFTFNYFGSNYTTCNVGTNGVIMFGGYNGTALNDFTFNILPSATEPNPMIAGLAHDIFLNTSGTVRYQTAGFPGNRVFVLSYENVRLYGQPNTSSTFQIRLYEATARVEVHVQSSSATSNKFVGVNGPGGNNGAMALATAAAINSPVAYRFNPPQSYITSWTPSDNINGTGTGVNFFSTNTIALNTPGNSNFNVELINQQTGCITNAPISVSVIETGQACDDNDPCTVNDILQIDCTCAGTFADEDNDGTCDASDMCGGLEPGYDCDDNDPCTVYDVVQSDCQCIGIFADWDNDGTCDALDVCAGAEPGTTCDDNNTETFDDVITDNCDCAGTPFNYGHINTPDASFCSADGLGTVECSMPLGIANYDVQWYYFEGSISCPSGTSTAGWNAIIGANALSYTPETYTGIRTFACFISPIASPFPASWAEGCVIFTNEDFNAQTIIGNPNVTPFSSFTYAVNPIPDNIYTWSVINGAITTGQGTNTIQVLWGQNGPYQVSLTENNGVCENESTLLVVNANCTFSVTAFAVGGNSFCIGTEVTLQTTTTATNPSYEWYFNGQTIPASNTPSLTINEPGSYQVMILQDACTAVSQVLNLATFPITNIPQIEVVSAGEGCLTQGATLSLNTTEFETISWNTGATTPTLSATESGTYTAAITDINGCVTASLPLELNLALEPAVPICLVTVTESNINQIVWEPILSEVTTEYRVYKEGSVAEQYDWIGSVPYGQDGLFTDASSNASVQASRYKLAIVDSCGIESFLTPLHKTIHLTSNIGLNNTVNLIWTPYEGFGFGTYNIYRGDALGNLTLLTSIASNLSSYTDTAPLAGPSFYLIEIEGVSCDPTRDVVFSRSNIIQLEVNAVVEQPGVLGTVWPNPTTESFNLQIDPTRVGSEWSVRNLLGQEIATFKSASTVNTIDATHWAAGVYLLVNTHSAGSAIRLIKE